MNIKKVVIEGEKELVEITRTDAGVFVTAGTRTVCSMGRDENRDACYDKAVEVARAIYGTDRRGMAAATNSMVHDVLNEMDRVAGC